MKRVLVVDAVEYPAEESARKRGGPPAWFRRALEGIPDISVTSMGASSPQLENAAAQVDAILLSGSPQDAWSDEPSSMTYLKTVRGWLETGRPMFGVCHGHQVMGRAAGADVARSPSGWELGNTQIFLTDEGRLSPIFSGPELPLSFLESHQDAVLTVPRNATLLGGNAHTPVQALSYGPTQFSVQFHPEFTPEILRLLWEERRVILRGTLAFDIDAALDACPATAHAPTLFANFLNLLS